VPQLADEQTSKIDRPFASPLWLESHWITDEGLAHEAFAAMKGPVRQLTMAGVSLGVAGREITVHALKLKKPVGAAN
jgi:hypothetical protein